MKNLTDQTVVMAFSFMEPTSGASFSGRAKRTMTDHMNKSYVGASIGRLRKTVYKRAQRTDV
jgi:hypothetical protein